MILATQQDVEDRLRRPLVAGELAHLDTVIEEASVIVESYLRQRGITYEEFADVPRDVVIVVSRIAARALTGNPLIPVGSSGELRAGPFAGSSEAYSTAVYMSKQDKLLLRGITGSAMSVVLVSDRGYPDCDE